MKSLLVSIVIFLASVLPSSAATLKWSGMRNPCKISAGDGVTNLDVKIGKFIPLSTAEWSHAIFNVQNRFQGSTPWATMAVGAVPAAATPTLEAQREFLNAMEKLGVEIFLEIYPRKDDDVPAAIDRWLGEFKRHACVKGLGIDLEYYQRVDDAMAKAWDERIKSHNPQYRMFFKHWEQGFMPPNYRGKGDIIFINTSSEASVDALNTEYAQWAAHFAPSACAFQIGYPADEDDMKGSNTGGWWKLQDPIKNWGDSLLAKISHPSQEIGLLWVCVRSGKTYNTKWDITKGAKLPVK